MIRDMLSNHLLSEKKSGQKEIPDLAVQLMTELEAGLTQIKPNWVEGIYLTGSITLGDFYAHKSDVDFVVLYKELPTPNIFTQLSQLHYRIQKLYPKPVLNGVYLTRQNLQASSLPTDQVIHFQDGRLNRGLFEMGSVALYELKTTAHTLIGPPTNQLPIDISLDHVKRFMYININSYWLSWLTKHSSLVNRKGLLILFPGLTEWGVLGVARQLYTLKQGKIVSKRAAGFYCLEEVPAVYRPILEEALQIRLHTPSWANLSLKNISSMRPSWQRATLTVDCMHYLIELFNKTYQIQNQPVDLSD